LIPKSISEELCGQKLPVLYEIREFVDHLISGWDSSPEPEDLPEKGEVLEVQRTGSITYRLENVSCGKGCKGCPHGPYWYGYWKEGGKTRSKYIGKNLRLK
jgi:hypothetical protein